MRLLTRRRGTHLHYEIAFRSAVPASTASSGSACSATSSGAQDRRRQSLSSHPAEVRKRIEIRWTDLDMLGHLNQAVYHEYLEEAAARSSSSSER
jgi:hypothetical protein